MATREEDVQKLINGILDTGLEFFDNPNGGYEYTCPFCCGKILSGSRSSLPSITDMKHDHECMYLIAKDLNASN